MTDVETDLPRWPDVMRCPFPFYRTLLDEQPVYEIPGRGEFLLSRREDVLWAARHPEIFSSKRIMPADRDEELKAVADEGVPLVPVLVNNDPPDHAAYRALMFTSLAPRRVATYEGRIRSIVDELIDGFADRGHVEFFSEFAGRLPMLVITSLLDMPREDVDRLQHWADDWTELQQSYASKDRALRLQRSAVEYERYLVRLLDERRARRGDDVLSELVHAEVPDGLPLGDPQLVALTKIFLSAGTETTAFMLANTMWLLLHEAARMRRVVADRSRIPAMLEESLRLESPAQWSQRRCMRDTVVGETTIPAGARVLLLWAAANRDEAEFADAETFDGDRSNARRHVAFGSGIHTCIGAPLARLEGRVTFERLLERLPNLRLDGGDRAVEHYESPVIRGITSLPLRFDRPGTTVG